jgi:hypothetical protein
MMLFTLDKNNQPQPERDRRAWMTWYEHADRRVSLTYVGSFRVSTIFLGRPYPLNNGNGAPPFLFETLVFDGENNICAFGARHYRDWATASEGHDQAVKETQRQLGVEAAERESDDDLAQMLSGIEGL